MIWQSPDGLPKASQTAPKIDKNINRNMVKKTLRTFIVFRLIFYWFLIEKWSRDGVGFECKLIICCKMRILQKVWKTEGFLMILMVRGVPYSMVKSWKIDWKMRSKPRCHQEMIFDRFLIDFGVIFWRKIEEKSIQEGIEMKMTQREQLWWPRTPASHPVGGNGTPRPLGFEVLGKG